MADTKHTEILIIGSGPAGWTAAVYGARAMRDVTVVTGMQPGGQLTITTEVENYPGFTEIQGPDLMVKMQEHAEAMGANVINDHIAEVDFSSRPFKAVGESGTTYTADSVVISTGAQAKWLGIPSEEKYKGFGVSACATCDGFFFRDQHVAVVGGGDSAVEEATFLTRFASKVTLVHRRDELRASKAMQDRAMANEKLEFAWNSTVEDILGESSVEGLLLKDTKTGETRTLPATGVFMAIGHVPNTDIFKGQIELDDSGYIVPKGTTGTNIEGVFTAGDVADTRYKQAITAAGTGCSAALDVEKFLED